MTPILHLLDRGVLYSLIALSFILFVSQIAQAQGPKCFRENITPIITNAERVRSPSISHDGSRITFVSNGNINNDNIDGNIEAYFFDMNTNVIKNITTDDNGNADGTSISGNGEIIAFHSRAVNEFNAEVNDEIYTYEIATGTRKLITNVMSNSRRSQDPSLNFDGSIMAFISDADLTGENGDFSAEVFLYRKAQGFKQITDDNGSGGRCSAPSMSSDGSTVAFACRSDINGGNPEVNNEVYFYDVIADTITQITDEFIAVSGRPSVNSDGSIIAFSSDGALVGPNTDEGLEIYYYDRSLDQIKRITDTEMDSDFPSITTDSNRISFFSRANLTGENPESNQELFVYDMTTSEFVQVTKTTSANARESSISSFGTHIAFVGIGNITGQHPELISEVHFVNCSLPKRIRNVPTLSEWGLIATAAIIGIAGFIAIRRRGFAT